MLGMILKMSAITAGHIVLAVILSWKLKERRISPVLKVVLGIVFGICAVLSTHFGVDYSHMLLNVRDLGPLMAGLYFDPVSGIIAGLIGGIERYIAGTYWGIGSYTRIACSISTCLAGFLSAFLHIWIFKRKKPSAFYAFFMGAVMEVFHMYVVFITHRNDMSMAFYVVKTCAVPMIIFNGIGLAVSAVLIKRLLGEKMNLPVGGPREKQPVSARFQFSLFIVTMIMLAANFVFSFVLQTQSAVQNTRNNLASASQDIQASYRSVKNSGTGMGLLSFHVGEEGAYAIVDVTGRIIIGSHQGEILREELNTEIHEREGEASFVKSIFGTESLCRVSNLDGARVLLVWIPMDEVYAERNAQAYETVLAYILLFTVIYVLISLLVQNIVVGNLEKVNDSLKRITDGNLDEKVEVYESSEFASLSTDMNQMVDALKGHIEAAKKRMEQELELARNIQESALPHNFDFPDYEFEIYATMDPAKEVGGDFYDFFLIGNNRLVLVIADVSGKGVPASLFMMRSKTAIRGMAGTGRTPAEIFEMVNDTLCEGNDAEMFVTVWIGIIDLDTGHMTCANAGHEYPVLMRNGEQFELYKQRHSPALATIEGLPFREYELDLNPGDSLFVYTDGVPEAINEQEEDYKTDRLVEVLNQNKDLPLKDLLPAVRQDIADFVGEAECLDSAMKEGAEAPGQYT